MPILLFALWLLFHERLTIDVIITGVIAVALVTLFLRAFAGWSVQRDMQFASRALAFLLFVIRLIWEVLKANINVIGIVLSDEPERKINPVIVRHKTGLRTSIGRVALANSITLTPGTVTVDVGDDCVYVHALDVRSCEGLDNNPLEKQLENMERGL
ncbi:MAG: Na+/H+ antiporter subunit E [Lachnospiraceae bacterium]|nr:Na+/H+ antiporter subunit E [Lachnospiraceae bacterium]